MVKAPNYEYKIVQLPKLFSQTQETLAQHRLLHQITIAASASRTTA